MGKLLGPREDAAGKPGWAPQATPRVQGTGCWDLAAEGLSGRKTCRGQVNRPAVLARDGMRVMHGLGSPPSPRCIPFPSALQEGLLVNSSPWVTLFNPSPLGCYSSPANLKASPFFSARHPQSRGNSSALT